MTSYDRYRGYVRSSPYHYQFRQGQHLRHQLHQLDETGASPAWRTSVPGAERAPADDGPSTAGRQQAASPSPAVEAGDGARRRPAPPPFTIDAILSTSGTTTGSGLAVLTSGAEWSSVAQQTTVAGSQFEAALQLTRETTSSLTYVGATKSRAGRSSGKRVRTIFTQEQLDRLEKEFERQQYMVGTERCYLAAQLGLVEAQVKVWFQNRRIKWRRQAADAQRRHLAAAAAATSADTCGCDRLFAGYRVVVGGPPGSSTVPRDAATTSPSLSATSDSSRASSPDFDVAGDFRFDTTGSTTTCNGGCDGAVDLRRTCV